IVYKAEDTKLERKVAIKFLPRYIAKNFAEKERFKIEAKAAAALNHPNITTIYAIEELNNDFFIVMEYINGVELIDKIKSAPIPTDEAIKIAIQIAEGLDAAHKEGIVHRDIKSSNIMITFDGKVKIMDFGLAKVRGGKHLTEIGTTVGTVAYMSPEQAQGVEVDLRSDIFSFGVVLYEILTSSLPFHSEYREALVYELINKDPQPISLFNNKVSPEFERIIFKTLEKDKEDRYQHVDDILADLRKERKNLEYAKSGYIKAATTKVKIQKHKKALKITFPSVVIILLLFIFFFFNPFKSKMAKNQALTAPVNSIAVMYFENIPDPPDKNHNSDMLTNLLITSLSQIKGLEVISRERLLDIQKDLGQTDNKTISASFANRVAMRAGVSTMLVGSILREKPSFAVTTRLIDVQSGKIIGSQQLTNFSGDRIFSLVDSLTLLIKDIIKPASSVDTEIKSVSKITTKSPEAYRAYVTGLELMEKNYIPGAEAAFSRAIELDSSFAMAYYYFSICQWADGKFEASKKSSKISVGLVDQTTERERLLILAGNFSHQENLHKAIKIYERLIENYPHEIFAYEELGNHIYRRLMKPEKSIDVLLRGLKIDPSAKLLWNSLAYSFAIFNKKQEALNAVNKYINLAPAEPNPYDSQGDIYAWFMEYDSSLASYKKAISLRKYYISAYKLGCYAVLKRQYKDAEKYFEMSGFQLPVIDIHRGKLKIAMKKLKEQLIDLPNFGIFCSAILTHLSYETSQYTEMLNFAKEFSAAVEFSKIHGRDYIAWALLKNGRSSEAYKIIDDMKNDVKIESYKHLKLAAIFSSGLLAFEEGKHELALEKFREFYHALPPNHEPNIFYGITLLKTGKVSEAIGEFKRIVNWPRDIFTFAFPGETYYWPITSVKAHYWLGVAYEKQGEKEKALKEFEEFTDIWKDADFNSFELKDAKARIVRLKD
ncbi:MAG: protein kinase, partial [Ignavibacteriaceae bacterium]